MEFGGQNSGVSFTSKLVSFDQNARVLIEENSEFWPKLWVLPKTGIFGQNSEFYPKLGFLAKTEEFRGNILVLNMSGATVLMQRTVLVLVH